MHHHQPWGAHPFMRMSKWNTRTKCGSSDKLQIRSKSRGFRTTSRMRLARSSWIRGQDPFLKSALAGLKTTPGLLPVPYHQIIIITPNINMMLIGLLSIRSSPVLTLKLFLMGILIPWKSNHLLRSKSRMLKNMIAVLPRSRRKWQVEMSKLKVFPLMSIERKSVV